MRDRRRRRTLLLLLGRTILLMLFDLDIITSVRHKPHKKTTMEVLQLQLNILSFRLRQRLSARTDIVSCEEGRINDRGTSGILH